MDFWVLHNGPPHVALWIIKRQTNLNSKLSTSWKLQKENSKRGRERGLECIKAHSLVCCCFAFECIREEVYFGAMLEFAAFCGTASPPPTWTAPTRASLSRWALGTTRDKQWSLASDGPQVPPRRLVEWAHTHFIKQENTSSSPRCLVFYI